MANKRRGKGEGSVMQLPNGVYRGYITIDGKRQYTARYATRAEAFKENRENLKNHEDGKPIVGQKQTLAQYAAWWLETRKPPKLAESTWERYSQLFEFHILPALGKVPLAKLTAQKVESMLAERLTARCAPRSVHHMHTVLHTALQDAMKKDLVVRNVCDLIDKPRVPKQEKRAFTEAEMEAILTEAHGTRWYALYYLGLTTAMRLGELLGLTWRDINFKEMTVEVRRTEQAARSRPAKQKVTKTEYGRRIIYLDETLIAVLSDHKAMQNEARPAMGDKWQDRELVFCTTVGTPINGSNLRTREFYPLLARVGIERQDRDLGTTKVVLHTMRHNGASHALANGESIVAVQAMLGHSQPSTTLNFYGHRIPGDKHSVSGALARKLAPQELKAN